LGKELTTPHRKNNCYKMLYEASDLSGCGEQGNEPLDSTEGGELLD